MRNAASGGSAHRARRTILGLVVGATALGGLALAVLAPTVLGAPVAKPCGLGSLPTSHYSELSESGTTCKTARAVAKRASKGGSYRWVSKGFHCAGEQLALAINPPVGYTCKKGASRIYFQYTS